MIPERIHQNLRVAKPAQKAGRACMDEERKLIARMAKLCPKGGIFMEHLIQGSRKNLLIGFN